ncbi:MAG: tetratricopeptide repeat protein [Candidatus Marinimicrobia bacterium]|nr:tetratricopeptide repeat protein [Candidatus Neomarinimicrobiota bacterium]
MAAKQIFSIYLDVKRELKTVLASVSGGVVKVESFDHAMMVTALKQQVNEFEDLPEDEPQIEDAADVFGVADENIEVSDESLFGDTETDSDEIETIDDEDSDEGELTNEDILLSLIQRVDAQKFNYAINIPATLLSVFHLRENYEEFKPKAREAEIRATVRERLEKDIPNDHIAYISAVGEGAISFSYDGNIPLLSAIDEITPHLEERPKFSISVPDEISILNLIRLNEQPGEDDYIVVIDMEETTTRLIITKGGEIVHIPPPIQSGTETPEVMATIYSKILYEQDMGNMPDFSKIILTGESRDVNAQEFLKEKFADVSVEYLAIRTDKIELPDELVEDLPEYAVPLGMAIQALIPKNKHVLKLNMLPDYVTSRQRTLKLNWHGMVALALIFSFPFMFNWQDKKQSALKMENSQRLVNLTTSIADIEWAEPLLDSIATNMGIAMDNMILIDSLAKGTMRFSVTLDKINRAMKDVNNIWLTQLSSRKNSIEIFGYSLFRNRIHRLAAEFTGANIQSVTPALIRNKSVYRFAMVLDKVVADDSLFNPVVIIPEPEPEPEIIPVVVIEETFEEEIIAEIPVETLLLDTTVFDTFFADTIEYPPYEVMDIPYGMIMADAFYGELVTVEIPPDFEEELVSMFTEEDLYDTVIVADELSMTEPDTVIAKVSSYFDNSSLIQVDKSNLPLLYSEAYGHYINSDYQSALDIFLAIADARLDDSLTDNAQYWVGECLLALDMPEQAIAALVNLFEYFPASNKIEAAQLLIGMAYAEVGRKDEAEMVINLLLKSNPDGEFAAKAKFLLKTIRNQE